MYTETIQYCSAGYTCVGYYNKNAFDKKALGKEVSKKRNFVKINACDIKRQNQ